MAQLITLYWRDIPAQVIAERGRGRKREQAKIELSRRFAIAIDEAAMRDGADKTDDYLAEWRRGEPVECGDDLDAVAAERAAALPKKMSVNDVLFYGSLPSLFGYFLYLRYGHLSHHKNFGVEPIRSLFNSKQATFEDGDAL